MPPKNPLIASQLAYLQQVAPDHRWDYGLAIVALVAALFAVWQVFTSQNVRSIEPVTAFILSIYWLLQYRIMRSATKLSHYDWQQELPDSLIGTLSKQTIMFARVRTLLRHHRYFVISMGFTLIMLSLAIMVFLYYFLVFITDTSPYTSARGIWKYVGTVSSGYMWLYSSSISKILTYVLIASPVLLILTYTNSLLSISVGLWAGRFGRALISRILLVGLIFGIFLSLYALRETPDWTCHRSWMDSRLCSEMLFQMRLVDSIQAFSLTFLDGGAALVTGLYDPQGYGICPFQIRHAAVVIVTCLSQLALSGFFLWRASLNQRKKSQLQPSSRYAFANR